MTNNDQLLYLSDQELVLLYQTIRDLEADPDWHAAAFYCRFMLATGLRVSESRWVRTDDFDFGYNPPVLFVPAGKGGKPRALNVIPEFTPHLKRARKRWKKGAWLFHSTSGPTRGQQCSRRTLTYWWEAVLKMAGVRHLGIHRGARHTHATWEALRIPIHVLRDRLGHGDIRMTERYYRHALVGRDYDGILDNGDPEWWAEAKKLGPELASEERGQRLISLIKVLDRRDPPRPDPMEVPRLIRCPWAPTRREPTERMIQRLIDRRIYNPQRIEVRHPTGNYCPWIPEGEPFRFAKDPN